MSIQFVKKIYSPLNLVIALCIGLYLSFTVVALPLDELRAKYQEAKALLNKGEFDAYSELRKQLEGYSLTPYLDYRAFLADLKTKTPDGVRQFKQEYDFLPISNSLDYQYLISLGLNEQWGDFLDYFPKEPHSESLKCYYYRAKYALGEKEAAWKGAKELWLNGEPVTYECDRLFKVWDKENALTDELILERMLLVYQKRNDDLLFYLEKKLKSKEAKKKAKSLITLYKNPEQLATFAKQSYITNFNQELTRLTLERIIRSNSAKALELLPQVTKTQQLSQAVQNEIKRQIVNQIMSTDSPTLAEWRDNELMEHPEDSYIERRIRVAIRATDWDDVNKWIDYLSPDLQQSLRWQFWKARIEEQQGKHKESEERLTKLLGKRDFYSIAAAAILGKEMTYPIDTSVHNTESLDKKFGVTLERIQELLDSKLISAAKSEWEYLLQRSSNEEIEQLANYALDNQWVHFSVLATIKGRMWGHLSLRFPLAYQELFEQYSHDLNIDKVTLMSLSRQESGLDANARSPVGARGLMQIMPATAKYTAEKIGYDEYEGVDTLNDVDVNIHIGANYLKSLLDDYDGNRIFALAAYNAGPHRVKRWREVSNEKLDVYAFIEAIPFRETRGYVQNILVFSTYYQHLLNEKTSFLTEEELNLTY